MSHAVGSSLAESLSKPELDRPTFIGCLAASVDGRIHPAVSPGYTQLGSPWDIDHLKRQRDSVDTILIGGETFREYPSLHRGHHQTPWVGIVTRGGINICEKISPTAPLFTQSSHTTIIFTVEPPILAHQAAYPEMVHFVNLDEQWHTLIETYKNAGATRVLCEGGGQIIAELLKRQWLDELHLTVTPHLLGSQGTPLVGELFTGAQTAPTCHLLAETHHSLPIGTERVQHWRITYPKNAKAAL